MVSDIVTVLRNDCLQSAGVSGWYLQLSFPSTDSQKCPPDAWGHVKECPLEWGETAVLTDVVNLMLVKFYENSCSPEHMVGPPPKVLEGTSTSGGCQKVKLP